MKLKIFAVLLSVPLLVASAAARAQAQPYPSQPIRIVVPYAPGGMTDVVARVIAQRLGVRLGRPVVVENRPGAATIVGAEVVAGASPDGYTLLAATNTTLTINPWLYPRLPYDPLKSFAPIALVASAPSVIVVNPGVAARTVGEVVQLSRARPGSLSYASYGNGSSAHLAGEMLKARTGIDLLHVPYKGSAPAKAAVMAGEVSMTFEPAFTGLPQIAAGKLRALAVMNASRSAVLPDVPTTAELGYGGIEMSAWVGLVAPAATPPAVVQTLAGEIEAIMADPAVRQTLLRSGAEPLGYYREAFGTYIRDETARYGKVIATAHIRAE
ncbi:tripartite tricarboxylate transporter substrate binding protein [Cupriavidus sp. 2TAF22]|uniref:tripartite tricarboxylate transporter substrate binding protein n=1 Tax=unclassified Cupriavidus TaxID=2640874 RepID=UPI003F8F05C8